MKQYTSVEFDTIEELEKHILFLSDLEEMEPNVLSGIELRYIETRK